MAGSVSRVLGADMPLPIGLSVMGKCATVVRVSMSIFAASERGGKDVASADVDVDSDVVVDVTVHGVPLNVG